MDYVLMYVRQRKKSLIESWLSRYPFQKQDELITQMYNRLRDEGNAANFEWFIENIELPFNTRYSYHYIGEK